MAFPEYSHVTQVVCIYQFSGKHVQSMRLQDAQKVNVRDILELGQTLIYATLILVHSFLTKTPAP